MIAAIREDATNDIYLVGSLSDRLININPDDYLINDNLLIWQIGNREDTYIGVSDMCLGIEFMRYIDVFEGIDEINEASIINVFLPNLKGIMANHDQLDKDGDLRFDMIIVSGDKIYAIDRSGVVTLVPHFVAYGYGKRFIRGAMDSFKDKIPSAVDRMVETMHSMDRIKLCGSLPLVICNLTKGERYDIVSYDDDNSTK